MATIDETAQRWPVRLVYAAVMAAVFRGFINLIPTGGLGLATLLIDSIVVVMIIGFFVAVARGARVEIWMVLAFGVALMSLALMPNGSEELGIQLNAVRGHIFYAGAGLFVAVSLRTRESVEKALTFLMRSGLIIAAYGCVQFVLRGVLPSSLLYPPDTDLFGYWGTDITRSTGLVGNSIVFGTLLTLIFALWAAKMVWHPSLTTVAATVVSGAGVLSTFSRMAIATSAAILLGVIIVGVAARGFRRALPIAVLGSVTLAIVAIALVSNAEVQRAFLGSFLWQGLFQGNNASVAGSTDTHLAFQQLALQSFSDHPAVGIGIGSQSFDSANAQSQQVITDGFWLATIVEGGLFLFVPTLMMFLALVLRLVGAAKATPMAMRYLPIGVLAYLLSQMVAAGFFNTGFYGKVPNVVFWIAFGLAVAMARVASRPDETASIAYSRPRREVLAA